MKGVKDSSGLYEVERRAYHAARPGFRIAELQISPTQKVPWHYHTNVHDTFYVVTGTIRIFSSASEGRGATDARRDLFRSAEAPAPRHQRRRCVRGVSGSARHRRLRFCPLSRYANRRTRTPKTGTLKQAPIRRCHSRTKERGQARASCARCPHLRRRQPLADRTS